MNDIATGSYLPPFVLSNEDLSEFVDTSSEWITQRTGIEERRVSEGETTAMLGAKAAQKAIQRAGISNDEIDLLILATVTPDAMAPSTASFIQGILGIKNAVTFDLVAGCTGFVYALSVANSMLKSGIGSKALIIGAEVFSKCINYEDRGSCILFGDGAGAMVLSREQAERIKDVYLNASFDEKLTITLGGMKNAESFPPKRDAMESPLLAINGQEVYKFAVPALEDCVRTLLERNDLTGEDIAYIVPHQANQRIIASASKNLKIDQDKFFVNIQKVGNTSSASIPIALDEMNDKGLLKKGDKVILAGFGSGLTWGSILISW